jgi:hypothetical protein
MVMPGISNSCRQNGVTLEKPAKEYSGEGERYPISSAGMNNEQWQRLLVVSCWLLARNS